MSEQQTYPDWLPREVADDLRQRHADLELHAIKTQLGAVVLRTPSVEAIDASRKTKEPVAATEQLVVDCAVYPDEATLRSYLARRPFLAANLLAPKLMQWATGAVEEADAPLKECRPRFPAAVLDALDQKYPDTDLHVFPTDLGDVVLRMPTPQAIKRWNASTQDRREADQVFVADCLAHPSREEMLARFAKRPLLGIHLAIRLRDVATGADEEVAVKLEPFGSK